MKTCGKVSVQRRYSSKEVVVGSKKDRCHPRKHRFGLDNQELKDMRRVENPGRKGNRPRVSLEDTHENEVFVAVGSSCGDEVGIDGVEIGDDAMVEELIEFHGELPAT